MNTAKYGRGIDQYFVQRQLLSQEIPYRYHETCFLCPITDKSKRKFNDYIPYLTVSCKGPFYAHQLNNTRKRTYSEIILQMTSYTTNTRSNLTFLLREFNVYVLTSFRLHFTLSETEVFHSLEELCITRVTNC